jgi:adenosine deaminase CECR1
MTFPMKKNTNICFLILLIINVGFLNGLPALPRPNDDYSYEIAREILKKLDQYDYGVDGLSKEEKIVNVYLQILKEIEINETQDHFYGAYPLEKTFKEIRKRSLYNHLKTLPKGGNLHMHEFQMLNRTKFLEIVQTLPEYKYLYICDKNVCDQTRTKYFLRYYSTIPPNGWTLVKDSNWTIEQIVSKTTLTGILSELDIGPSDSGKRWQVANQYGVFSFYSDLVSNNNTRFAYMNAILEDSLEENVQLLELRRSNFGSLYYFDNNGTKIPISASDELNQLKQIKDNFIESNPLFIDFVFIIYTTRGLSKELVKKALGDAIKLQDSYQDFIRGFDLVGEEDQGHTLLFHSDSLRLAYNKSRLSNGTFGLYFHTVETNWPEDMIESQYGDNVATLENIYDSLVLDTHRIGHGLGMIKHPKLYDWIKNKQIAIEVCPASNQILGYISDLRNHPAINYLRSDIPIVLAGDDPGSFGYNELTIDYYLAFISWGLNLADLKKISRNSIEYSSIPNRIKGEAIKKWSQSWQEYISKTYSLACSKNYPLNNLNVTNIYPSIGPLNKHTNVTIYGYGFENFLCKRLQCVFGKEKTEAYLTHSNRIQCDTPIFSELTRNLPVYIQYDDKIIDLGVDFSFENIRPLEYDDDNLELENNGISSNTLDRTFFILLNFILIVFFK